MAGPSSSVRPGGGGQIELELADGTRIAGSVRKLDPPHLLELEWIAEDGEVSLVRMKVVPDREISVLVLDHIQIPERLGIRYLGWWELALGRFERVAR